jgi:hypothetical protein
MMNWKWWLGIETLVYVLCAYFLEYLISKPIMSLQQGKDGGLMSELYFLVIVTLVSTVLWYRKQLVVLASTLLLMPFVLAISYFLWIYLLPDGGIGFLLVYLCVLTVSKLLIYPRMIVK